MPRGLSDIQKCILRIAAAHDDGRAYYAEVCHEHWGWEPAKPDADLHRPGTKKFDREQIGHAQYSRTMAKLSQSVRRLEARGLGVRRSGATSRWSAFEINDSGRQVID